MRIFQMTDLHLRGDGKLSFQKADTTALVNDTIEYMLNLKDYELPDLFMVTGDLSEGGTEEGYLGVRDALRRLPRPFCINYSV